MPSPSHHTLTGQLFQSRVAVAVVSSLLTAVVLAGGASAGVPEAIADNSVTSAKIVNNAVLGEDIADGTIRRADLAPHLRGLVEDPVGSPVFIVHLQPVNLTEAQTAGIGGPNLLGCTTEGPDTLPGCNGVFAPGTTVNLTAQNGYPEEPGTPTSFLWGADAVACGTAPTCTITMDSDKTVSLEVADVG